MQKILIVSFIVAALVEASIDENVCEGIKIDNKYYNEELVKSDIYKPSSLVVDYNTNTLYFSYIYKAKNSYKTASVNLNTKEYNIVDVNNGFSQTVDQINHVMYIGSYKGVYKYDVQRHKARVIVADVKVWDVFYKDVLFFIEFLSQTLYTYVDGKSSPFDELADIKVYHFAIDDEDYMLYSNETGLFGKKKGTKDVILYKKLNNVDEIRDIVIDKNSVAFVCAIDGIYKVDKINKSMKKVVDIKDAYGLAFDADNQMIYSKGNSLIRFVPTKCL